MHIREESFPTLPPKFNIYIWRLILKKINFEYVSLKNHRLERKAFTPHSQLIFSQIIIPCFASHKLENTLYIIYIYIYVYDI